MFTREKATLEADIIVKTQIEKQRLELEAEAQAEQVRRRAAGEADAIYIKMQAEARGMEEILKKQAEAAGVSDHFHFLGMQNNPYPYIAAADLYVQPSRYENYSVVILEAMALCKPILATIPAAQIQITSGKNGLLCEADPDAIARAIQHLYLHREEMAQYPLALQDHSLEKQNQEIMDSLYRLFDGE